MVYLGKDKREELLMIANYHTHTWRCNHADGKEFQYVDNAIAAGLHTLGFSDHAPYRFPHGHRSHFRMDLSLLEDYVNTVLALQKEYEGRISLPLGLELEYYPDLLPDMIPIFRDYPFDYVILGQHFLGNEWDAPYSGRHWEDKSLLERYTNQTIEAMQTGIFTYFAHPELFHFTGDEKYYQEQARRICREAKSCGIPLEINLLGILERKHYPNPLFLEVAGEEGCAMILGRDAHSPEEILMEGPETAAMELVRQFDLHLLETAELRKPF